METFVRDEVEEAFKTRGIFRLVEVRRGLVAITPLAPFSLADIYALRCFGTVGFVLGTTAISEGAEAIEALAAAITSPLARRVFETFCFDR